MTEKPNALRRVAAHLNRNKDIYIPVLITVASLTTLAILGEKVRRAAVAYENEALAQLAAAPEGSRLLMDIDSGDFVIAEPIATV